MSEDHAGNSDGAKSPELRHSDARRRLLKTLTAGGIAGAAVPDKWARPVVDAVLLPAHAQATGVTCSLLGMAVDVTIVTGPNDGADTGLDSVPIDQTFNTNGIVDFTTDGPGTIVVTAQYSGTSVGNFNLDYTAAGDLNPPAGDSNAAGAGGTVSFPTINVADFIGTNGSATFTVTPPSGCGQPRTIVVTFNV